MKIKHDTKPVSRKEFQNGMSDLKKNMRTLKKDVHAEIEVAVAQITHAVIKSQENFATKDDLKKLTTKDDLKRLENKVNSIDEKVTQLDHKVTNVETDVSDIRRRVIDLEHDTPTAAEFAELKRKMGN